MSLVKLSVVQASLKPTLDVVWGDEMKGKLKWEDCGFKVTSTKDAFIDDQEYAGTGIMPVKQEGAMIAVDSVQEGYSKRYTMSTFALRLVVSEEAIADCKYDKAIDGTGNIARSAKWTQEYINAGIFANAFNAAFVGGDAVPLGSLVHKLPKGGTYANMFTTAMSLSETAVETMIVNLSKMPSSNGLVRGYTLKKLVVPMDLWFRANRILKSELQNDTANNAKNILMGMGIQPVGNPFFTSTTNWFGISDAENGLRHVWRQRPVFREHNTEDNWTMTYSGYQRFSSGWTDPRGFYGSNI
jgi:hypothetical protein